MNIYLFSFASARLISVNPCSLIAIVIHLYRTQKHKLGRLFFFKNPVKINCFPPENRKCFSSLQFHMVYAVIGVYNRAMPEEVGNDTNKFEMQIY